jgi:hypothetical protein
MVSTHHFDSLTRGQAPFWHSRRGTLGITRTPRVCGVSTRSHSYGYGYYPGISKPYPGYPMLKTECPELMLFLDVKIANHVSKYTAHV